MAVTPIVQWFFLCVYLTESYCHPVPLWYNIVPDTLLTRHGVKVNYTCKTDYYFDSTGRKYALTSKCSNDGTWQPPFKQCTGMSIDVVTYTKITVKSV